MNKQDHQSEAGVTVPEALRLAAIFDPRHEPGPTEIDNLDAAALLIQQHHEIERLKALSVTNILLDVVPGDGSGFEVYAKSVADVEAKLGKMGEELEDWQLGIKRHPLMEAKVTEQATEIELTDKLLNARNLVLEQIPECPVHGTGCLPHAQDWIQESIRIRTSQEQGVIVITRRPGSSRILAVTRQDEEGRILKIIAEDTDPVPTPVAQYAHYPERHMVGPNDGGMYILEALTELQPGTKLYAEPVDSPSAQILAQLTLCSATDPAANKAWAPKQQGRWMTVNIPSALWQQIVAATSKEPVGIETPTDKEPGVEFLNDVRFVYDTFVKDRDQGCVTKDKTFAISILGRALASLAPKVST